MIVAKWRTDPPLRCTAVMKNIGYLRLGRFRVADLRWANGIVALLV
jgi:hypothetical protein